MSVQQRDSTHCRKIVRSIVYVVSESEAAPERTRILQSASMGSVPERGSLPANVPAHADIPEQ